MDFSKNTNERILDDTNFFIEDNLNSDGLKFFSDEIVVEQSRTIPVKTEFAKNILEKQMRNSEGETDSESEVVSPPKKLKILNPSHTTTDPHLPSETDNRYSSKPQTEKCHLCDYKHHRRIKLYEHQKSEHTEYWEEKMAKEPSWRGQTKKLVLSDEYTEISLLPDGSFNCNLCGNTYKKAYQVRKHVDTVHRREELGVCGVCGMKFKYTSGLKRHMKTHGGEFKHVCRVCGKGFRDEWNYREVHLKKHHPQEYEIVKKGHVPKRKK